MAYVITEPCGGCKDRGCVAMCPVDCIHEGQIAENGRIVDQLFINPLECICCGLCEPECPVEAIYPEDELPEQWREWAGINARFFARQSRK